MYVRLARKEKKARVLLRQLRADETGSGFTAFHIPPRGDN